VQKLPFLTRAEKREVDRATIEDYRIELIQMMENAGRVLAHLVRDRFLGGEPVERRVLVLCGTGNNGGGGLVGARRLHGLGANVRIVTSRPVERYLGVPEHQADSAGRLGIPITHIGELTVLGEYDVIVDAIVGTGLEGAPSGGVARLIEVANELGPPVVSLDTPSGLDVDSGTAPGAVVSASATLALGLPSVGFRRGDGPTLVGDLYVGDIGVPPEVYRSSKLGYEVGPLFAHEEYVAA